MAITKGLFGFDPYEVQMQQAQRLLAPIAQASNPYERIGASLGTLLGASLFDVQDPRLAKASKITAITKQVMGDTMDPTDPKIVTKLENLSKILFDEGEPDAAMFALEQARKFSSKEDKLTKIGVSSDGKAVYRSGLNEFTLQNGVPTPFRGSLRAEQSVSVNVGQAQKKEIIKNKADLAAKLETEATNADTQLTNATAIANVIDRSFTGFGADAVLKVGQIADAFGVTVSGTTESEQLQQLLSKLAQGQAKTLPGSLSEKELMFLREAIGTRGVTKETLRSVARRIEQDSYTTLIGNNKLQKYISEGKDLNNFDFAKNTREARRLSTLLEKASPEQRKQILGY